MHSKRGSRAPMQFLLAFVRVFVRGYHRLPKKELHGKVLFVVEHRLCVQNLASSSVLSGGAGKTNHPKRQTLQLMLYRGPSYWIEMLGCIIFYLTMQIIQASPVII